MKKLKLSLSAALCACILFAVTPVKADGPGQPCGGLDPDAVCDGGSGGDVSLPVDSHVWYLIAVAGIVGAGAIASKTRKIKAGEL